MALERKIINCGESGTTARMGMIQVASGVYGEGIYVFTGKGKLPERPFYSTINVINQEGIKKLVNGYSMFKYLSLAVPGNRKGHMPVTIYVGNNAARKLIKEINSGKYSYVPMLKENQLKLI